MASRKTYDLIDKGSKWGIIAVCSAIGLALLCVVFWALSLWFHAEPISFSVFIGIVLVAGAITGLYHLREWAIKRRKKMDREELEAVESEKLDAYKARYGVAPRTSYDGERHVPLFDEEPRGWNEKLGKIVEEDRW